MEIIDTCAHVYPQMHPVLVWQPCVATILLVIPIVIQNVLLQSFTSRDQSQVWGRARTALPPQHAAFVNGVAVGLVFITECVCACVRVCVCACVRAALVVTMILVQDVFHPCFGNRISHLFCDLYYSRGRCK